MYLIRAPIPHGGDGHADDDPRPRKVRGHGVPEYVEGVVPRDAAGCVGHPDSRDGFGVSLHQCIPASDLHETSTRGRVGVDHLYRNIKCW